MPDTYLVDLAYNIWTNINGPCDVAQTAILSKLTSSQMIGQLNVLIDGCYTIETGNISPALGPNEQGIYGLLFEVGYYKKKAIEAFGPIGAVSWLSISEGDSKITRSHPTDIAKFYQALSKDANTLMNDLIYYYKANQATARSVDYLTIVNNRYGFLNGGGLRLGPV